MTSEELAKWGEGQIQELIKIGISAIEAERSVTWVITHLPPGADPTTYVFPAEVLNEPIDEAAIADARLAWYADPAIPPKYKRLLDSREVNSSTR